MQFNLNDSDAIKVVQNSLRTAKKEGKSVGLTSGCFDLVHFHHISFFIRCQRYCDILMVGVDSDELVREIKGPGRPVIPDFHRAIMVDTLRPVSFVFVMNSIQDFGLAAKLFRPNVIFKNDYFRGKEKKIVGHQYAKRVLILADQVSHNSTTDIIRCLSSRK